MDGLWQGQARGPILRRDLLASGMLPEDVDKAVRRRLLIIAQRGVLVGGAVPQGPLDRACSALASCSAPDAVVSHESAARIHGLDVPEEGPEHLIIPRNSRRRNRPSLRWHTNTLDPVDVEEIEGVPVTTVARTLVDLACRSERMISVWRMDDALRRGLVAHDVLLDAAVRAAFTPGIKRAKRCVYSADAGSMSPIETEGRLVLVDAGLPAPETQIQVDRRDGCSAYLDLGYRKQRVGIELDGRDVHDGPDALYRDRYRQNDVLVDGWLLLRFAGSDVRYRRRAYVAAVERALRVRS